MGWGVMDWGLFSLLWLAGTASGTYIGLKIAKKIVKNWY